MTPEIYARALKVAPEALRMLLFGLAMVVVMLYRPAGLWPAPKHGEVTRGARDAAKAEGAWNSHNILNSHNSHGDILCTHGLQLLRAGHGGALRGG